MYEKFQKVSNPLTVIAIFAGLVEVSGTGILPFIETENQNIYVWFLMIFPTILITLFFITLNFNSKVLYAPSDFQNEDNYLRGLGIKPASPEQLINKITEITEEDEDDNSMATIGPNRGTQSEVIEKINFILNTPRSLIRTLILRKMAKNTNGRLYTEHMLGNKVLDAVFVYPNHISVVEIKILKNNPNRNNMITSKINRIVDNIKSIEKELLAKHKQKVDIILVVAHTMTETKASEFKKNLSSALKTISLPVKLQMLEVDELRNKN